MRRDLYRRPLGTAVGLALLTIPLIGGTAIAQPADTANEALLIIDIQEFYFPEGSVPLNEPEAACANAARLLERFRAEDRFIVHVGHNARSGRDFHADVAPREGEYVVMKDEVSCFKGTDLFERLRQQGVERLVICGMQTHMCLEAAARAAADLGFKVVVVGDACATRDLAYDGRNVTAADVQAATLRTLDGVYARVVDTDTFLTED